MNYASNNNAAMKAPSSQMVTGSIEPSESKQFGIYEIEKLSKEAERMGLMPELRDLVDAHKELQKKLQEKAIKLGILEAFAMESIDENVVELRNQLFTVVTLLYSEKIDEMIREHRLESDVSVTLDTDIDMMFNEGNEKVKEDCPRYNITTRMREYLTKRRQYKSQLAALKKKLKNNAGL